MDSTTDTDIIAATVTDKAMATAMTVAKAAVAMTALLTVAGFVLSYAHLATVAASSGVPAGFHAWVWPGTIDTFIFIGELLIAYTVLVKLPASPWGWGLTIGGSAASIAFNVAGVGGGRPIIEYAVAGAPPVAALFAFGALMHQLHRYVALRTVMTATTVVAAPKDMTTVTDMVTRIADTATAVVVPTDMTTVTAVPRRPELPPTVMATVTRPTVADTVMDTVADTVMDTPTAMATVADTKLAAKRADMTARVATVADMLEAGKTVDGHVVAAMYAVGDRTGRRILGEARALIAGARS